MQELSRILISFLLLGVLAVGCSTEEKKVKAFTIAANQTTNKDLAFFPDPEFANIHYDTTDEKRFVGQLKRTTKGDGSQIGDAMIPVPCHLPRIQSEISKRTKVMRAPRISLKSLIPSTALIITGI